MTIGERIKQRRLELGLSQEDLAKRLGNKSRASVCTVEKDKEDLTTDRIRKYAEALETTPAYLMGWTDKVELPSKNDSMDKVMELSKQFAERFSEYPEEEVKRVFDLLTQIEHATPETRLMIEKFLESIQQHS